MKRVDRRRTLGICLMVPAVACLLGACSASEQEPRSFPEKTTQRVESRAYGGGEPCPRDDKNRGVGCSSSVTGDFDGDGAHDTMRISAQLDRDGFPRAWTMEVSLASGTELSPAEPWWPKQTAQAPPPDAPWWVGYPEVLAALDADGDGSDEALVKLIEDVLHGGSIPKVALFAVREDALVQVARDGEPLAFAVGGVSNYGEGMRCPDEDGDEMSELVLVRVENAVSERPRWVRSIHEWTDGGLRHVRTRSGNMTRDGFPDPDIAAFYQLRCDGVVFGL